MFGGAGEISFRRKIDLLCHSTIKSLNEEIKAALLKFCTTLNKLFFAAVVATIRWLNLILTLSVPVEL